MLRTLNKPLKIIAATCENRGIGFQNKLPWSCPEDMAFFKKTTLNVDNSECKNAVIMGRKTWESIGKALPNRVNVVITRQNIKFENIHTFSSLLEAHLWLMELGNIESQFIIGGSQLYKEALQKNWSQTLYLTSVPGNYECDIFFPEIPEYYSKIEQCDLNESTTVNVFHNYYGRHYEEQYLGKMNQLLHNDSINGRNGSVHTDFQWSYEMDLQDGLPLFSTRKGFWKGICKELLFFIHGQTNSKILEHDGIGIWKGNTTRDFLDHRGLHHYSEGDMGPMYGWVWRNYGAEYHGMEYDYRSSGHDQLRDVVDKLLNDPCNRRILMTSYDPSKVKDSVLAPCHSIVNQFYVRTIGDKKYLDMFTYQRSADMFLGVYFNIPSNATLLTIIAQAVGMIPGKLYMQLGNCHVYSTHKEPLLKQLNRTPNDVLPKLSINSHPPQSNTVDNAMTWIEGLDYEHFEIENYHPQSHIKADMVA